ncbi:MAG: hypothetical protein ACPL28_11980 [bacterium]
MNIRIVSESHLSNSQFAIRNPQCRYPLSCLRHPAPRSKFSARNATVATMKPEKPNTPDRPERKVLPRFLTTK